MRLSTKGLFRAIMELMVWGCLQSWRTFKHRLCMNTFPFIFSNRLKFRLQRHFAFWAFWWLFQGVLYAFLPVKMSFAYTDRLPISIIESLVFLPAHIFLAYVLMYFVIPKLLLKNRYLLTGLAVLLAFVGTACLSAILAMQVIEPVLKFFFKSSPVSPSPPRAFSFYLSLMAGLRGGITIGGLAAAIKLMKYWYIKEQTNLQLQKENAENQLQLLKAQIHPHFLFNTLNNIYSHTQGVAPVASHLVMGLSDMLRTMLYECAQPLILLRKELKMVEDYILLEKIRYDERFDIHVDVPADTGNLYIAPLLLLPLVENCFKHGASNMLEQPWLSLVVHLKDDRIQVKLMNGKASMPANPDKMHGIGILNVSKRLELLYPGKHVLQVFDEEEVFVVNLEVQLERLSVVRKKEDHSFILSHHE